MVGGCWFPKTTDTWLKFIFEFCFVLIVNVECCNLSAWVFYLRFHDTNRSCVTVFPKHTGPHTQVKLIKI